MRPWHISKKRFAATWPPVSSIGGRRWRSNPAVIIIENPAHCGRVRRKLDYETVKSTEGARATLAICVDLGRFLFRRREQQVSRLMEFAIRRSTADR